MLDAHTYTHIRRKKKYPRGLTHTNLKTVHMSHMCIRHVRHTCAYITHVLSIRQNVHTSCTSLVCCPNVTHVHTLQMCCPYVTHVHTSYMSRMCIRYTCAVHSSHMCIRHMCHTCAYVTHALSIRHTSVYITHVHTSCTSHKSICHTYAVHASHIIVKHHKNVHMPHMSNMPMLTRIYNCTKAQTPHPTPPPPRSPSPTHFRIHPLTQHTPGAEVAKDGVQLSRCEVVKQACEFAHPLLTVSHQGLLQRTAIDAQEAHVGVAVLTLCVRVCVCVCMCVCMHL